MKKTVKKETIVNIYQALDNATLGKMETADRFVFIKALRPLKKVIVDFNDFKEDAVKRLKPENYDTIAEKVQKFNGMSREDKEAAINDKEYADALKANGEFNLNIDKCLREELDKEVELEFAPLSEDAFGKLMESNTEWNAGVIMAIEDLLCGKEG